MSGFSSFTENSVLNLLFRRTAFMPAGAYLALFTSSGGLENNIPGSQTEVAGAGYARVNTANFGGFTLATVGSTTNVADNEFPIALGDWGTITHIAVVDNADVGTGNVLAWGALTNPRVVYEGDAIRVRAGALNITLD